MEVDLEEKQHLELLDLEAAEEEEEGMGFAHSKLVCLE